MSAMMVAFFGPGFRLDIPSTWMVYASMEAQANFLMPPYDSARAMTLIVRISQVVEPLSVDQAAYAARQTQARHYDDFHHLSDEVLPDEPPRILQRVRWQPPEGDAVVQHHLFCVADAHLIYTLTATRPEALPPDEAAAWDDEVDAVLRTFTVQAPLPT